MLKADIVSVSGGALGLVVTNLPPGELRDHPDNVFRKFFVCTGAESSCCPVAAESGARSSAGVSRLTPPQSQYSYAGLHQLRVRSFLQMALAS